MARVRFHRRLLAKEISVFSKYFDRLFYLGEPGQSGGEILDRIAGQDKRAVASVGELPKLDGGYPLVVWDGVINFQEDVQKLMQGVRAKATRRTRLALIAYNSYFNGLYKIATFLRLRRGLAPKAFLTYTAIENLARLSGWEVVRVRPVGLCPIPLLFIDKLINWLGPVIPVLRHFSIATVIVFRPVEQQRKHSLSIVIPARNEKGNIENALKRLEYMHGIDFEVIFVEGNSTDGTWQEIERVKDQYAHKFQIKALKQTGKGKNDAVRVGFAAASKDVLTILDADLTAEPEFMLRFLDAYNQGLADFINGNRLTLPMEKGAMQTLNFFGNLFFAKALNNILQLNIGDCLCGTKMLSREDYFRIKKWREEFGDFDPFGDFELLFGASLLCLGAIDVPVIYRARSYGTTNISRFSHGWMLLKMTFIGFFRIRLGST